MKNSDWKTPLASALELMPSSWQWKPGHAGLYAIVLDELGPDLSRTALNWAVRHCKWRPAPAELRDIAIRIAHPTPDASQVTGEIVAAIEEFGLYGCRDPDRPNCYSEGMPDCLSAEAVAVVRRMGGWMRICQSPTEGQVPLEKQIAAAHASIGSAQLYDGTADRAALPASIRQAIDGMGNGPEGE